MTGATSRAVVIIADSVTLGIYLPEFPSFEQLMATDAADGSTLWDALHEAAEIKIEKPGYVELVFSLVLVWGFGDALSTLFAAKFAGVGLEANPWIRVLLTHEPLVVIALKMAVALYVGVVLLECRSFVEQVPWWRGWLLGVVGVGAAAVLINVYVGLLAASALV